MGKSIEEFDKYLSSALPNYKKDTIESVKMQLKAQKQVTDECRKIIKSLEEELIESKRLISVQKQALLDVSPVKRRLEKELAEKKEDYREIKAKYRKKLANQKQEFLDEVKRRLEK